jgi:glycosyltransferase involved in cell wall biosynthesis
LAGEDDAHSRMAVPGTMPRGSRLRVLFAGHDLKFAEDIIAHLNGSRDFEVRVDQWAGPRDHDERESRALADWANVVVAEWCLGNAVWYSQNLPLGTGLVVRVHRVELETSYPEELDLGNVHRMIAVSPHFVELIRQRLPALGERAVYIPNAVDCDLLDQPKLGGSEFRLGLLGGAPRRKRLDLALDIFDRLRRRESRYILSVKGKLPTEHRWVWRDEEEREYFLAQMARINASPWRDSVVFEPFGRDIEVWFRKIGFILSPSDDESFHLSIAEGMASGAVPIIRLREEVPGLYPNEYVVSDVREAADLIERIRSDAEAIEAQPRRLKVYARENFDLEVVAESWARQIRDVAEQTGSL